MNDSGTWGDDPEGSGGTAVVRSTDISLDGSWTLDEVAYRLVAPGELKTKRLVAGDLVVVKSSGSAAHLGKTALVTPKVEETGACFANFVQRLRPSVRADSKFLWYVLNSRRAAAEMEMLGNTTTGLRNLNGTIIGSVTFPGPALAEQRAIADFLDTETARVDALITKRRRMNDLLNEHTRSEAESLLRADRYVDLRRVADLLPGYMFSGSDFGPEGDGPRLLRGVNVSVGALRWDDTAHLKTSCTAPGRYLLATDDIVVGMDRPFITGGTRVARIDKESAGALLVQRVCRIRARSLSAAILIEHVLASARFLAHVEPDLTGVSVPHLSDEQIGSMPIPVIEGRKLDAVAERLQQISGRSTKTRKCLASEVSLIKEHRQALITAAVTGELEIPGAAA